MKIAIPVDENNIDSTVCMSFGRTPYFLIYNLDNKEIQFLDNSAIASLGGAGIKAAQSLVDNNIDILLTPRCGENAAKVFNEANIKMYKTNGESIRDNIEAFINGNLNILSNIHPGFHGN